MRNGFIAFNFPITKPLLTPSVRQAIRSLLLRRSYIMSAAAADSGSAAPPRKLKILMLHGYTQSGPIFHGRTKALEKALNKAFPSSGPPPAKGKGPAPTGKPLDAYPGGIQLFYPTGSRQLRTSDIPGFVPSEDNSGNEQITENYGWWVHTAAGSRDGEYGNFEESFESIAAAIKEADGIDAVIGFSQGAAGASMVASLLEPGRREAFDTLAAQGTGMAFPKSFISATTDNGLINPPLKFAAIYCGFVAHYSEYRAFYEPKIATPTLHVLGTVDTVVEEHRSLDLAKLCSNQKTIYHPGGHFLPVTKDMIAVLVGFIRETCGEEEKKEKVEESIENMDVPF